MSTMVVAYSRLAKRSAAEWISAMALPMTLGVSSALACVAVRLFFRLLQWGFVQHTNSLPSAAAALSPGRRIATPILGAVIATLVIWLSERFTPREHFEEYVEAVRLRGGRIPFLSTAWRTLSSAFSVASGAAIGREGSMIQFATAVTSWIGTRTQDRTFSLSQKVAFGAAAAVAAAYQAPIAGVFFASEIVLGEWTWGISLPLLLASLSGWLVSRTILGAGPLFPVAGPFHLTSSLLWSVPLALLLATIGPAYQKLLHIARGAKHLPLSLVWGASIVGILSLFEPRVWGNGDIALTNILQPGTAWTTALGLLAFRLVATTLCVGTGTVGGVFTPTVFAGAAFGLVSAHLFHSQSPALLVVCGMAFLLAAVTHAPIMSAFMAVELSGHWNILPVLLPCAWLASSIARRISSTSLYGIASPEPAE